MGRTLRERLIERKLRKNEDFYWSWAGAEWDPGEQRLNHAHLLMHFANGVEPGTALLSNFRLLWRTGPRHVANPGWTIPVAWIEKVTRLQGHDDAGCFAVRGRNGEGTVTGFMFEAGPTFASEILAEEFAADIVKLTGQDGWRPRTPTP